jgi:hypothetical protein
MMQVMHTNHRTIRVKAAAILICTFASSLLVAAALLYATSDYSLSFVLVVSTISIASLARMWMIIIGSLCRLLEARAERSGAGSATTASVARARFGQRETMPAIAKTAEWYAAYRMRFRAIIPGRDSESMSHHAGA